MPESKHPYAGGCAELHPREFLRSCPKKLLVTVGFAIGGFDSAGQSRKTNRPASLKITVEVEDDAAVRDLASTHAKRPRRGECRGRLPQGGLAVQAATAAITCSEMVVSTLKVFTTAGMII